jgi:hypothetical protein
VIINISFQKQFGGGARLNLHDEDCEDHQAPGVKVLKSGFVGGVDGLRIVALAAMPTPRHCFYTGSSID